MPVVDPQTYVLVGIVSDSDIYRSLGEHASQAAA